MNTSDILFIGVKGHVVAFNKHDGTELWGTKLAGGFSVSGDRFVTLLVEGERVFAHTYGRLFCLDAQTGRQLWTNELDGLSYDIAMLAHVGASSPSLPAVLEHRGTSGSDGVYGGGGD
ncbi:MAG: PQQ-binding-like beta-propeller repeat protein [Pyrinomonadaceae bacterium]